LDFFCFSHVTSYLIMWQIISPVIVYMSTE
jgi:hypothetical protein